jgi:Mce-associated membrane protein
MAGRRLRVDVRKDLMVTPRERSRPTRRRIAGERSRLPGTQSPEPSDGPQAPESSAAPEGRARPSGRGTAAPAEEQASPTTSAKTSAKTAGKPVKPAQAAKAAKEKKPREPKAERPAKEPKATRTGATPPNWVLAVLAGLLVAALALDGFVAWREVSQRNAEEASARALHSALIQSPSVAERAAVPLLSYRYDTIDKDLAEAQRYLTDEFRPGYTSSIGLVRREAARSQVTVEAEVLNSGIVEAGGNRAEVLLFVNQTTTSPTRSQPTTALNRVVFSMVQRDGTWKVADIKAF